MLKQGQIVRIKGRAELGDMTFQGMFVVKRNGELELNCCVNSLQTITIDGMEITPKDDILVLHSKLEVVECVSG